VLASPKPARPSYDRTGTSCIDSRSCCRHTYAICVPVDKTTNISDFVVGDILYIERKRENLIEMTLRRVTAIEGGVMRNLRTRATPICGLMCNTPRD
jgi:hypothetical protein